MSYKSFPNPVKVCQELYGMENVNDVRDCIMDSIYRYYGRMCEFHQRNLSNLIQEYLVQVLKDAGRNPNAVKLAMSPSRLQPDFFVKRYIETKFDKEKAFKLCLQDCKQLRDGESDVCKTSCVVDRRSIE
jgi:hypothetical protein